jgi:two-component system response regulator RegA
MILLIEDDEPFVRSITASLGRRGFQSYHASSGNKVREILLSTSFTHAILDLKLQNENGLEILRQEELLRSKIKTLVLTGYGTIVSAVLAIKLGAINYLTKPATIEDIITKLELGESPISWQRNAFVDEPSLNDVEWQHIHQILHQCGGNISMAALRLGLHRRTLQRKLEKPPAKLR